MSKDTRPAKLYTPARFAQILDKSERTIYRYIQSGKIEATNTGSEAQPEYKIPKSQLDKFVEDVED